MEGNIEEGPSRNVYKGPMDKAKGGRFEHRRQGWVGQGHVVGGKLRQLYLDNSKKRY